MKATFTKGYAAKKLAENRAPVIGKIDTKSTGITFELAIPHEHAFAFYRFMLALAQDKHPEEAFKNAFDKSTS